MAKFWKEYEVNCPDCPDGGKVIKAGQRNGYQRYRCRACQKWFRADGQARNRKNAYTAEMIGATVRDYYSGLSIKQLAESIADRYDVPEPSKSTIYRWIEEYTDKARVALAGSKAEVGDHWVVDEMFVKIAAVQGYAWIVMDKDTRYILSAHLSLDRDGKNATQALLKALEAAKRPPVKITTDKAKAYPFAMGKILPGVKHLKSKGMSHWVNNQMVERLNGTYRAREKTMRGMETLASGQHWLDGFTIYYNLLRDHHSLGGRKPAQLAKVEIPYKEWADFVRADIEVPASKRKKVVPRGTPKVPVKYIERARAEAEKKKKKRKGKGRVRSPKPVPEEFKTPDRQMRLLPSELDAATLAKLKHVPEKPAAPRKGHQFKLEPVTANTNMKTTAPKPVLPKMPSKQGDRQNDLMGKTVPHFMRKPRPPGAKRH